MTEGLSVKVMFNVLIISIGTFMAYIGIDKEAFTLFGVLLFIDYFTGLLKANSINQTISSNKMKYGIVSKLSLLVIPIMIGVASRAIDTDLSMIEYSSINIMVLSEMYSIIGNIYSIRTKEELPEWEVISIIGKNIRNFLIKDEK